MEKAAATQMDNRRYALHVRSFNHYRDNDPTVNERNGVAQRRVGSRLYDMGVVRKIGRELRPGEKWEDLKEADFRYDSGRERLVINPAERFAAKFETYETLANQGRGYDGRYFDLAILSSGEMGDAFLAKPGMKNDSDEIRYGGQITAELPPDPAGYAFGRDPPSEHRPLAEFLRGLTTEKPGPNVVQRTVELMSVPRPGGEGGPAFEVLVITDRRDPPPATRPTDFVAARESRREFWFDPAAGGLLVRRHTTADGELAKFANSYRINYARQADGAWLPTFAGEWYHGGGTPGGQFYPANFTFALAEYDAGRLDPTAGGFTWADLGLRSDFNPIPDFLDIKSDDPTGNGRFEVIDGELVDTAEAARRRRDDEHGGL